MTSALMSRERVSFLIPSPGAEFFRLKNETLGWYYSGYNGLPKPAQLS
jgi:hypothetical protein